MNPFTVFVLGALATLAFGAIGLVLWINRPLPRRRRWRDRDEHETGIW